MTDKKQKAQYSAKELKGKMDGTELDLSMNSLEIVPVKELVQLEKLRSLDLSCNRLESLPAEFCKLEHLTKLDLSQNSITELPEQFGRLSNLQKLDLYKNQLEVLPVSMCRMKKLSWLDLKDNPLVPTLAKVAGDCLDAKQCQAAASKVVKYLQQIQSEQERLRQLKLAEEREAAAQRKRDEEAKEAMQEGKKKKEKKKNPTKKKAANGVSDNNGSPRFSERTGESEQKGKRVTKKTSIGSAIMCGVKSLFKLVFISALAVVLVSLACAGLIYWNCMSKTPWIPSSRQLCKELYHFSATGEPPKNLDSLYLLSRATSQVVQDRLGHVVVALKTADYAGMLAEVQEKAGSVAASTGNWMQNDAGPWLERSAKSWKVGFHWVVAESKEALRWGFQNGMALINQVMDYTREGIRTLSN